MLELEETSCTARVAGFWRRSSPSALDPRGGRGYGQSLFEYVVAEFR